MRARAPGSNQGKRLRSLSLLCVLALAAAGPSGARGAGPAVSSTPASGSSADQLLEAWFERSDTDHNGELTLDEFKAGLPDTRERAVYQRLPAHFRAMDTNQDGFLEAGEFAALPIVRNAEGAPLTLASADANHDGKIDFREYVALVAKLDRATP